jgi:superfamily I DNA/RNA helicase
VATREEATTGHRPAFEPSFQQADFLDHLARKDDHVLLRARAGSGKSTTCRQGAWLLADQGWRSTYACFNRHIATEFQRDLPRACRAATLHSLGFAMVRASLGDVVVDADKVDKIAAAYFPDRRQRGERLAVCRLVSAAKNLLADADDAGQLRQVAGEHDIELPEGADQEVLGVVPEVLAKCRDDVRTIDLDDMVWLPVARGMTATPDHDVLFVDEAQDLNPCQHELVTRLAPQARVVVVGDDRQAIYGWRGADHQSLDTLRDRLAVGMTVAEKRLTVTRRCPQSVVRLAQAIVPDLDHPRDAPEGSVGAVPDDRWMEEARPGDMVLCRTNGPLVSACFQLLRDNRRAFVRGRDIGKGLLALIARLRKREVFDLVIAARAHLEREVERANALPNPGPVIQAVQDKVSCLLAMCEGADTVEEVRHRVCTLFSDLSEDNAVLLSSVHRAKGLERDHVIILRPELLPGPWAKRPADQLQELNLAYVAATRARERLTFAGPVPTIFRHRA